jgi:hypothetical protein
LCGLLRPLVVCNFFKQGLLGHQGIDGIGRQAALAQFYPKTAQGEIRIPAPFRQQVTISP